MSDTYLEEHIAKMHQIFHQHSNAEVARQMKSYMKEHFDYFGIKTGPRRLLTKEHNGTLDMPAASLLRFVQICLSYPEREMHHYGLDTVATYKKHFTTDTLQIVEYFTEHSAWWDTVDMSNSYINYPIFIKNTLLLEKKAIEWSEDQNMWKRRLSIIAQLKFQLATNTALLEKVIFANLNSREFFINKAIGWALREYGAYNAPWVLDFVARTPLQTLSKREAIRKLV